MAGNAIVVSMLQAAEGVIQREVAAVFKVHRMQVSRIWRGKTWSHLCAG